MYHENGVICRSSLAVASILIAIAGLMSLAAVGQDDSSDMFVSTSSEDKMTGDWFLTLDNETVVGLSLKQVDGETFGYGDLALDNTTKEVVAGGKVDGNLVTLYAITIEGDMMYKLNFTLEDGSVSGVYNGYSTDGIEMNGTVSGSMYVNPAAKMGYTPKKKKTGNDLD